MFPSPLTTASLRAYLQRIPLFTRLVLVLILFFALAGLVPGLDVRTWGALGPDEFGVQSLYRMNTFPFVHRGLIHAGLNALALTPLMERFERENGSFAALAQFFGPYTTIPALLYVFLEKLVFRGHTAVMGASIWVFFLLGIEAIRTYRTNPYLTIATYNLPTWSTPLLMAVFVAALVPGTSLLGHVCGLAVGYLAGLNYLSFLTPPDWAIRWVEKRLDLVVWLPKYVSLSDRQKMGRYGGSILPSMNPDSSADSIGLV